MLRSWRSVLKLLQRARAKCAEHGASPVRRSFFAHPLSIVHSALFVCFLFSTAINVRIILYQDECFTLPRYLQCFAGS